MSKLLIEEPPRMFSPSLATIIGLNESIILQQVHFWLLTDSLGKDVDGEKWIYNSVKDWQGNFPWWSEDTIQRTITNLEAIGLLKSANYNTLKADRTKWYTLNYTRLAALEADHHRKLPMAKPQTAVSNTKEHAKEGNTTYSGERPVLPDGQGKQARRARQAKDSNGPKKTVPPELVTVFCQETGITALEPVSKTEYAEYSRLWRDPLWHIHHLLCADNQAESTALIREVVRDMVARQLDISSPNSIKKVATAIKARKNRQRVVSVY